MVMNRDIGQGRSLPHKGRFFLDATLTLGHFSLAHRERAGVRGLVR